jgi:hypothetical protein
VRITPVRAAFHYGVTNRCKDGKYVLFLDYDLDTTMYEWIQEEVQLLQRVTNLGSAYVFKTQHGYHVMFLEKFYLENIVDMLGMTTCDQQYKDVPLLYGKKVWVLRTNEKTNETMQYVGVIHPPVVHRSYFERSTAHMMYIKQRFKIPRKDFSIGDRFDGQHDLVIGHYFINERIK